MENMCAGFEGAKRESEPPAAGGAAPPPPPPPPPHTHTHPTPPPPPPHTHSLSHSPPLSSSSGYKWLNVEPLAVALGFLGWVVPASSPSPSYGGGSLFGAFTSTIGAELAKFPAGPSIDSPFWLQLVVFHVGLFVCMTLAQIGVQGRKQGYF